MFSVTCSLRQVADNIYTSAISRTGQLMSNDYCDSVGVFRL